MRILCIILLFFGFTAQAQNYQERIAQHREAYKNDFLKNINSPLNKSDLKNLNFYEADSTYKVLAKVTLLPNQKVFKMPTYAGTTADYLRYAHLNFVLNGKALQLTIYKSISLSSNPIFKDHLFLPFTDETNSTETYGGGRYIDLNATDIKNGKIEVDFNKAYNPYCAYSEGYRCPVPPEENDFQLKIEAGEKLYTGKKKH